ncbi:MAG: hypothetical protein ACXWCE_21180, partial [Caldimonas sp.]
MQIKRLIQSVVLAAPLSLGGVVFAQAAGGAAAGGAAAGGTAAGGSAAGAGGGAVTGGTTGAVNPQAPMGINPTGTGI